MKARKNPGTNYRKASGEHENSEPLARSRPPFRFQSWPFLWSSVVAVAAMLYAVMGDTPIAFGILPILIIACLSYGIYGRVQLRKNPRIRTVRPPTADLPSPITPALATNLPKKTPG